MARPNTLGVAFGTLAADNLIAMRANDGRNAPVLFTQPPAPGVWRPTPSAFLPMAVPWMGAVTPMLLRSGAQFGEPGPPPALTSARYTRDFAEVKKLGSATSTARTTEQTSTALFFSGNPAAQFNAALRDQMTVRHPDIVDAARMFAAVDMSEADAFISVWHAKYLYGFWRPITAIRAAHPDLHSGARRRPQLRHRAVAAKRRRGRQSVAGDPLPLRGHGRRRHGPTGRGLGSRPLLRR
jgi:hypothetical protein